MPNFWPFNKKRRSLVVNDAQPQPPLSEKQPTQPKRASTAPTPPVPRRSSKRGSQRKRPASPPEKATDAHHMETKKRQGSRGKGTMPQRRGSIEEDITALPVSKRLQSSPHLRPVDLDRPAIPYNFRQHADSQTSIQRQDVMSSSSRPQTLRSRKSAYDSATPQRRRSSKKPKGDALREEEIRAMSAAIPISKRPGEGPLRKDSKKQRNGRKGASTVSLPMEDSVHSSMSGVQEHRGWEVGFLDVFNPRPAVRLSGAPQYPAHDSHPNASFLSRLSGSEQRNEKERNKTPVTKESNQKRQTIGDRADGFDASDLRMLLERDAKRREKRKKEQQEKLDRKLKNRAGRNRGDSDRRRQDDVLKAEEAKLSAEQARGRELMTPPDDVHPAFRENPTSPGAELDAEKIGLGIGSSAVAAELMATDGKPEKPVPTTEELGTQNTGTYLHYKPQVEDTENPFADPLPSPAVQDRELASPGPFETPLGSPMEEPVVSTAQAVRMSQPGTPPLSPIQTTQSARATSGLAYGLRTSDLPEPPSMPVDRRASETKERRAGAWASLFRRGGTNFRKPGEEGRTSPSEFSFSNTSRESMRNQPLPAHLVDTQLSQRSKSGTPVRTQSKFREDLPEMPISPPDSRMPSPDVTAAAAQAAAARRPMRSPTPMDIPGAKPRETESGEVQSHGRSDTPISPSARGHGLMSASLASVDSEGSWLANSAKRQSGQSGLSRGVGSLNKRQAEFNASYEELGGDKDAEYFRRVSPLPAAYDRTSALAGASPDEVESVYSTDAPAVESPANEPLTVHGSVRRQPTLVRRDPRVKSREGLLAEYSADMIEPVEESEDSPSARDDFDPEDSPKPSHIRSARSIDYSRGHTRGVSAGSAKLLDIPPRASIDRGSSAASPAGSVPPPVARM